MKIDLDPENIQVAMDMWRQAVDMKIPLAPELRSHFFTRRGSMLEGFVKIANNWIMLLNGCKGEGNDQVALDALRKEINDFKNWAESGIDELVKLAAEVNSGKG